MSADHQLRQAVDDAADAVGQAERLLAAAKDRLAEARKAFLDDYLETTPIIKPAAGFHASPATPEVAEPFQLTAQEASDTIWKNP